MRELVSIDSEMAVLGGLMINNAAFDDVADIVREDDFSRRDHRTLWAAICAQASAGNPFDLVTLAEYLDSRGELNNIGGLEYLGRLHNGTPAAANVKSYARAVCDRATRRKLVEVGQRIASVAIDAESAREAVGKAQAEVLAVGERNNGAGPRRASDVLSNVIDSIEQRFQCGGELIGLSTGLKDLDAKTLGLHPGDLVIVAGRPSQGKTTLAMNFAEHAAIRERKPALVFSLEMSAESLTERMQASIGRIPFEHIRSGRLDDGDWARLTTAVSMTKDAPLFIDDEPGLTVLEMQARARRIKREHGLALIVVDYIQLMEGEGENRVNVVSAQSRGLKRMAREIGCPVVALSQLNRGVEQRADKRPVMSDLRDSGAIEQDADVILFLYRDEYYNKQSPNKGTAECIIGKQRQGETGMAPLAFNGRFCRFDNLEGRYEADQPNRKKEWAGGFDDAF